MRGQHPSDRGRQLTQLAAAVIGTVAAAQPVHQQPVNPRWVSRSWVEADHSYHPPTHHDCRCTCIVIGASDGATRRDCPEHGDRAYRYTPTDRVVDAAREYWRTGGDTGTHHELMDAVEALNDLRGES